jgi:hypothetical protein
MHYNDDGILIQSLKHPRELPVRPSAKHDDNSVSSIFPIFSHFHLILPDFLQGPDSSSGAEWIDFFKKGLKKNICWHQKKALPPTNIVHSPSPLKAGPLQKNVNFTHHAKLLVFDADTPEMNCSGHTWFNYHNLYIHS